MSGLFNGNSSVVQPTAATKEVEAPKSSGSNDFSAAIASIGTAIGELKEAFPSMMEKAFTTAISSDATNNALYDALASATYDSMAVLHDEGKLGPNERERPSEAESRGGRDFTRAELLAIETIDQNEQLATAISTAFDRSLEKSKFDRAADVGAAATKAAVEEGIVAGGGTAYLNVIGDVAKLIDTVEGDEKTGVRIVLKALEAPVRQIAANAGIDGAVVVDKILTSGKVGYGCAYLAGKCVVGCAVLVKGAGDLIEVAANFPILRC